MTRMRKAVVVATALLAGAVPLVFGGAPAMAATAPVTAEAAAAEVGTVVQEGGRTQVPSGVDDPGTLRFTATPTVGTTGPLTARVELLDRNWDTGAWSDHRVAGQLRSTCSVAGGPFAPCDWDGTSGVEPGTGRVVLDLPVARSADRIGYAVTIHLDSGMAWMGSLDASVTLKDAAGTVVATGEVGFDVVQGSPQRPLLFGRDHDGVLWSYRASYDPAAPLDRRVRIGGGWQKYTAVVPMGRLDTAGVGHLVARDKDGVLWFYKGTNDPAAPFEPRVRIGGGWNKYTAFAANGGMLVARDSGGVLWNYERDRDATGGAVLKPRVQVGGGWNTYNALSGLDGGAIARDKQGVLWKYDRPGYLYTPSTPFEPRVKIGGGWQVYTAVTGTGGIGGGFADVVARDAQGRLWLYETSSSGFDGAVPTTRTLVGGGWNTYDLIF
ncbi:hypothetical protein ACFWR4_17630 [Streptomyces hydrogenans]|uniref:hypothetical protein n=1 Tax=Streptomyces hydrogenans TaxID=1873719 RepID=UPI003652B398